jgi:hypothetical protein
MFGIVDETALVATPQMPLTTWRAGSFVTRATRGRRSRNEPSCLHLLRRLPGTRPRVWVLKMVRTVSYTFVKRIVRRQRHSARTLKDVYIPNDVSSDPGQQDD